MGFKDKSGFAQCTISYFDERCENPLTFVGKLNGTIVEPRGVG